MSVSLGAGLAAAAGDRLGTAEAWADVEPGVGDAAATVDVADALGVSVRAGVGDAIAVGAALVGAPVGGAVGAGVAVGAGAGDAPESAAQARVSDADCAAAHTERFAATHVLPSAAVRDSENRMKG